MAKVVVELKAFKIVVLNMQRRVLYGKLPENTKLYYVLVHVTRQVFVYSFTLTTVISTFRENPN